MQVGKYSPTKNTSKHPCFAMPKSFCSWLVEVRLIFKHEMKHGLNLFFIYNNAVAYLSRLPTQTLDNVEEGIRIVFAALIFVLVFFLTFSTHVRNIFGSCRCQV